MTEKTKVNRTLKVKGNILLDLLFPILGIYIESDMDKPCLRPIEKDGRTTYSSENMSYTESFTGRDRLVITERSIIKE